MKHIQTHQILALLAAGFGLALPASAQFVTGFETAQGYTLNTTLTGVDDPVLAGADAWYVTPALNGGGSVRDYLGSGALRLHDSNSLGWSIGLNVADAIDYSKPFTFSFDIALASHGTAFVDGGNVPFVNVRLGADNNSNSNKSWLRFAINTNGTLALYINSGGSTTTQTTVGALGEFLTDTSTYLSVSISVDPVTHTYTNLTLRGDLQTKNVTTLGDESSLAGTVLPWIPNTPGEPPMVLWAHTTGPATSTSYIDNISLTNIPEPSTYAALLGLGGLFAAVCRRRRRA